MKLRILTTAAAGVLTLSLAACGTTGLGLPGATGSSSTDWAKAVTEIAKDPNCGHTDRLNITLGPIPSGSLFLERNCPIRPGAVVPISEFGKPPS